MSFQELLSRTAMLAAPADTTDLAPLRAAIFAGLRATGWTPVDVERGRGAIVGTLSDEALLAALVHGEASAFDLLFDRHAPKLNGYARRRLSGADAADAVQESFLVLFEKAATVLAHQEVNVAGFLFGVLRNKMWRVLARHARETVMEDPAAEPALHDDGLVALLHQEEGERLAELVERTCNPLEQEVVAMTLDGHEGPKIAGTLGIEPGHVRVLRHRAFAKLRQAQAKDGAR